MKEKKLFSVKIDDLPLIAQVLMESFKRDLNAFTAFSPVFNADLIEVVLGKIELCRFAIRAWVITQELKEVSTKLYADIAGTRLQMNALEAYVKLASPNLDIAAANFGIKQVRKAITSNNAEKVPETLRQLLFNVERNITALAGVGMPATLPNEIKQRATEIDNLNTLQNVIESKRAIQTDQDMHLFNDLWITIQPVIETGKALFRGIDETKLKDYTISQIEQKLHHEKKQEIPPPPPNAQDGTQQV
jgi:hypothetical protein